MTLWGETMAILDTKYAVVNEDYTEYVYIDQDSIKHDKKMPRRSGTAENFDKAEDLLARFYRANQKEADWYDQRAKVAVRDGKDANGYIRTRDYILSQKFHIVKLSVEKVQE